MIEQYAVFYGRGHPAEDVKNQVRNYEGINILKEVDADVCIITFRHENMLHPKDLGLNDDWLVLKKSTYTH